MDPHSRLSQFNKRQKKVGPITPSTRYMDTPQSKPGLAAGGYTKRPTASRQSSSSLLTSRPIATNSRIKQDEQYRKDMYLAFVNNALQQKSMGNSDAFDELVDQFNLKKPSDGDSPSPVPQLRLWILALSHVVSRLDRAYYPLVEAIVGVPWTTMDTAFVKSYTTFIGVLVSARPEYLSLVLGKIAHGLTYHSGLQALDAGLPESSSSPLTRRLVYDRLHYLLRHLMSLIPTLPSTLQPLLANNFPHKRQSQVAQVTYIRNLLRVMEYCPELSDRILAMIIDRALQIDVEIQVELDELEDAEPSQEPGDLFELDPFDTLVGQEGSQSESDGEEDDSEGDNFSDISSEAEGGAEDEDVAEIRLDANHIQDMVNKLDAILKLIFDHFDHPSISPPNKSPDSSKSSSSSRLDSPVLPLDSPLEPPRPPSPQSMERAKAIQRSQFHTLLAIFDRSIIRTFKSRYTQFLIFWYSSLDPEFSDLFQGMLVSKALLEDDQPVVTRAAAASYIASFVSRALFVDREGARRVVAVLCNFLKNHLDIFDTASLQTGASSPQAQSMAHHSIFYAVAQAVFLIFCFRWRDLLDDPPEEDVDELSGVRAVGSTKKWISELNIMQRVVISPLNPLRACSPNVVTQFARVAHAADFIYCYSILESNKRSEYGTNTTSSPLTQRPPHAGPQTVQRATLNHPAILGNALNAELNTFFPFDPYKLPKSSSYIEGVYREWSAVAVDDDEDEDEESEEEGVEGDEDEDTYDAFGRLSVPRTVDDDVDGGLGVSFGGMSISPARPSTSMVVSVS
ncbi:hypothetical protein JAAARDRAFT_28051 [Jaapia argillacea MUCL 33604]|uniref:RNA polymerase I-specific transcription initiation factor RRN3 n=1 Tax=Jaapia argillacea MUCL 33604 TaxID=933084 RepID=A0A067QP81_9AGAM|nr:hypothetical protein JAAARDRAFT_28051 [Jaapia argillacea MUCL 33604]